MQISHLHILGFFKTLITHKEKNSKEKNPILSNVLSGFVFE